MIYRPFFYWVHKALPLVYDDSLSYMELLSKVLKYLNDTIIRTNENSKAIGQLADIVSSYLGSPEFTAELERILDEMAEDGTLDSIVNDPKMFVPNQMRRSSYADRVLECAGSYMYYASDCSSIAKASAPASTYKPVYNTTGKNWQSLLGKDAIYVNDFDYDDTMDSKPVMYQNCSGFVTLLTMARDYLNSPYAAAFGGLTDDLISYCKELGTIYEYPYTMDFLHWQHTYSMFFIMESSGCNPNIMYRKGAQDKLRAKIFSKLLSVMHLSSDNCSTEWYPPNNLRYFMISEALFGPMPSTATSVAESAVLISTSGFGVGVSFCSTSFIVASFLVEKITYGTIFSAISSLTT